MQLNANKLGLAMASTVAVLWIVCSLLILALPSMSMSLSGYMMHTDMSGVAWDMRVTGLFFGLVLWAICAYVSGWLLATFYNALSK